MNQPDPNSPRSRLQALLAIPERQRTDAQWDEINELEILLAPENRQGAPMPRSRQDAAAAQARPAHNNKQNRWSRGRKRGR